MTAELTDEAAIKAEFRAFIGEFKSIILATVSPDGLPESSYAPALQQDGSFYIFVSQLATHTANLQHAISTRTTVSLMLIQPESEAKNLFARQRAVINASPVLIERTAPEWPRKMDAMQEALGDTVKLIRQLGDFQLIRLQPLSANYVAGFGKAYKLSGNNLETIEHQKR